MSWISRGWAILRSAAARSSGGAKDQSPRRKPWVQGPHESRTPREGRKWAARVGRSRGRGEPVFFRPSRGFRVPYGISPHGSRHGLRSAAAYAAPKSLPRCLTAAAPANHAFCRSSYAQSPPRLLRASARDRKSSQKQSLRDSMASMWDNPSPMGEGRFSGHALPDERNQDDEVYRPQTTSRPAKLARPSSKPGATHSDDRNACRCSGRCRA